MAKINLTEYELLKIDLRTLWSDTLVELLCDAVKGKWSDKAIQEIIKELYNKGYKTERRMTIFEMKLGSESATRSARFII